MNSAAVTRLCLGVIQNSSLCDYYIGCYCSAKLEPKVRDMLRMGVYQLLFLDRIPARAAVSEAVALCKSQGCARAAGLVNAVLRRIADNINSLPPIPGEGTAGYLSIKYSSAISSRRFQRRARTTARSIFPGTRCLSGNPPRITMNA